LENPSRHQLSNSLPHPACRRGVAGFPLKQMIFGIEPVAGVGLPKGIKLNAHAVGPRLAGVFLGIGKKLAPLKQDCPLLFLIQ
jgi:hypothetical protein